MTTHVTPDIIVSARASSRPRIEGEQRARCRACRLFVWLTPLQVHIKTTQPYSRIMCNVCMRAEME